MKSLLGGSSLDARAWSLYLLVNDLEVGFLWPCCAEQVVGVVILATPSPLQVLATVLLAALFPYCPGHGWNTLGASHGNMGPAGSAAAHWM